MAKDAGNGTSERSVSILEGAAYSALSRHYLVDKYNIAGNAWDWTPDGQLIVLADRTTVKLIDVASASTVKSFRLSEGAVYNLDISPDASLVVVSNDTISLLEIWEVETESKLKDIDGWGTADNVVFSLDGRWLAISDAEKVAIVDTQDWHTVIELKEWVQEGTSYSLRIANTSL